MSSEDEDYYRARAIEERKAAEDASQREVAMIHAELARLYDALVERPELRPGRRWADGDAFGNGDAAHRAAFEKQGILPPALSIPPQSA